MYHFRRVIFLLLMLICSSCALGPSDPTQSGAHPTANVPSMTPTPTYVPHLQNLSIKTLALAGFDHHISDVEGTAHGFVFQVYPPQGDPTSIYTDDNLYYYNYASHTVRLIDRTHASPTNGFRSIHMFSVAGDTVAYAKSDNNLSEWEFGVLNVVTGQHILLDSAVQESAPESQFPINFFTDGQRVIWSSYTSTGSHTGSIIRIFDIASQTSRTLYQDPQTFIYNPTITGNTVFLMKIPVPTTFTTEESIWKVNVQDGKQQQIGTTHAIINLDSNSRYFVWDEAHNNPDGFSLHGMSLTDSSSIDDRIIKLGCGRPKLYGHYMSCVQIATAITVVDLQTGENLQIAAGESVTYSSISPDRVIWVNNITKSVEYLLLPPQ